MTWLRKWTTISANATSIAWHRRHSVRLSWGVPIEICAWLSVSSGERKERASSEKASVKRREERRWVPVSIFPNTSVHQSVSRAKMSNVKMPKCAVWKGFTRSPCLYHSTRSKPSDRFKCWHKLSKLTNHRIPTAGIPEWSIEKLHIIVSPQPPRGFRAKFLDSPSLLSWSLEQAMLIWTLMFGTENTWTV